MRLAALCRCGRCGGPRRWSFSAGARAGPPVSRSARHASMLLALPDRESPWEPSRDCLPDEIADERVADGIRGARQCIWLEERVYRTRAGSEPGGVWAPKGCVGSGGHASARLSV